MKMNSNNEHEYRYFKVGASYESGVVYSHQKLVVSEVQTKTQATTKATKQKGCPVRDTLCQETCLCSKLISSR